MHKIELCYDGSKEALLITLQQLQYFITVCKYQSLTKAAREVEQASVTVIWRKDVQTFPAMDRFIQYIRAEKQAVLNKEKCGSFSEDRLYKKPPAQCQT